MKTHLVGHDVILESILRSQVSQTASDLASSCPGNTRSGARIRKDEAGAVMKVVCGRSGITGSRTSFDVVESCEDGVQSLGVCANEAVVMV